STRISTLSLHDALPILRRYPHAAVYVAQRTDGAIVGRLSLARDTHPASMHVADLGLMVAIDMRRRGVGRALLEAAVDWARSNGVDRKSTRLNSSHRTIS